MHQYPLATITIIFSPSLSIEAFRVLLVQERPQAVQNERRGFAGRRMTAVPRGASGMEHTYYTSAVSSRCRLRAHLMNML